MWGGGSGVWDGEVVNSGVRVVECGVGVVECGMGR